MHITKIRTMMWMSFLLVLFSFNTAGSIEQSKKIVGRWQSIEKGVDGTLIFNEDGTYQYIFLVGDHPEPMSITGTYALLESKLLLNLHDGSSEEYFIETLKKRTLVLRHKQTVTRYIKIST